MDQRDRADKIEPTLAAEAIENAEANEPTDPTDRIEPAEPMERIEPDEPIDRIDPLDAMLRMEPEDPGERDDWAEARITTFWQAGEQQGISGWMLARSHIAPGDRAQSGRSCPFSLNLVRDRRADLRRDQIDRDADQALSHSIWSV
jgi:hypothetical protein